MKMKIFNNPARRHLMLATTRVCALLVFLISSPLLYFISAPVVASSLVTISFTVAFIGSTNKHTLCPSLPFDPSPPLVLQIINLTTFSPNYSKRRITFYIRPPSPPPLKPNHLTPFCPPLHTALPKPVGLQHRCPDLFSNSGPLTLFSTASPATPRYNTFILQLTSKP
jgi:hypothetical protein